MDRLYQYRRKGVHDIPVRDMVVRLWSADGPGNSNQIAKLLDPLARTGFVHPYMALMPDWHPGEDAIVGSVVPTKDMLLPTVVGGDIGCGMCAVRLPLHHDEAGLWFKDIAAGIRKRIPVGTNHNAAISARVADNPLWKLAMRAPISSRNSRKLMHQFGSLGGGNHFLEIQKDLENRLWIMLHSGSRYLGVEVRDHYVAEGEKQKDVDPKLYAKIPHIQADSPVGADYLIDIESVMAFAHESRKEMMLRALEVVADICPTSNDRCLDPGALLADAFTVCHNYVALEEHFGGQLFVHRKGAIRLPAHSKGMVPGSMGTASFIVEGRGNASSFFSCAHGGGRSMSRSAARRMITLKTLQKSMDGIVCGHDAPLVDEAPEAYKDIRAVMRAQRDLVKIVHELHPLISIKGR